MNQQARERTVENLKKGRIDVLVATDVAARGLDVERISHVVNYDIPYDPEAYVHRIGRTGRAGREGTALLFIQPRERRLLSAIEKSTRQKIEQIEMPTAGDLKQRRIDQFSQRILGIIAEKELDIYHGVINKLMHEHEITSLDIAAALTWSIQKDRPFVVKDLPAPKESKRQRNTDSRERRGRDGRGRDRDSNDRKESKPRRRKPGDKQVGDVKLETFRIAVGRDDGVTPREIVGAIANEAGLEGKLIGHIDIQKDHSLVDLPEGMPKDIFKHLQKVRVCGKTLNIKSD
jgi:ATP-dependent RNA helicase DeaD